MTLKTPRAATYCSSREIFNYAKILFQNAVKSMLANVSSLSPFVRARRANAQKRSAYPHQPYVDTSYFYHHADADQN